MRFSTIVAASALLLAGFTSACRSDLDCARGEICCFISTKDSQGRCYSRGCAPPHGIHATARIKRHRGRFRLLISSAYTARRPFPESVVTQALRG
ncbi:hypothetical protein LshimejAT787_1102630 [Lyophyllum shimeji]|uniref:Uncharacterized protein n=1 Tax=Lyophyllum shimeji TaxID=47721 RepID=A0A9P3UR34_LYOSH|nr:hypothetical protein LshimejAT787_1102630 [Lyophyllum shimeji]